MVLSTLEIVHMPALSVSVHSTAESHSPGMKKFMKRNPTGVQRVAVASERVLPCSTMPPLETVASQGGDPEAAMEAQ